MSIRSSFGNSLLRAALSLGFLGCLAVGGPVSDGVATNERFLVRGEAALSSSPETSRTVFTESTGPRDSLSAISSGSTLIEIGLPDEFRVPFEDEDSSEIFRVDIQQRTFCLNRETIRPMIVSKIARSAPPNISSPLLV